MNKKYFSSYEVDASGIKGDAIDVIFPETIAEIKRIILSGKKIVPRGGGTGLAGGSVPQGGVIVDLSKMDRIVSFNQLRKTVEVEAGVILDELNYFLEDYGLEFPINPSSHSVCTIGGMIATNAVGSRAVKYNKTSDWVEWLEVIDGKDFQKIKKTSVSDYAGMEGTTGIILKACLKLSDKPKRTGVLIKKNNLGEIVELARKLKVNKNVSMIEFFGAEVSSMLGLEGYNLIVEYESGEGNLKGEEYQKILDLRDSVYPLLAQKGYYIIEDPCILLDRIENLIVFLERNEIPYFGHLGSGILHPCFKRGQEGLIDEMMRVVKKLHGQISGEHGIGLLKKDFLEKQERELYLRIKKRTDPEGLFNPGKIV
jgi:glycolate oxidase